MELDINLRNREIKKGTRLAFIFILMVMGLSQILSAVLSLSTQAAQMIGLAGGALIALLGSCAPEKGTLLKSENEMTGTACVVVLGAFMLGKLLSLIPSAFILKLASAGGSPEALEGLTSVEDDLLISFLSLGLVTPVCEEIVFRGCIGRSFMKYGVWFAMIMSTVLFALYHCNAFQLISTFLPGLVLFYVAMNYSLKWSILLHFINNGVMTIGFTLLKKLRPDSLFSNYGEYAVEILLIIAALALMKKDRAAEKVKVFLREPKNETGVYRAAMANIWFILILLFVASVTALMFMMLSGTVQPGAMTAGA